MMRAGEGAPAVAWGAEEAARFFEAFHEHGQDFAKVRRWKLLRAAGPWVQRHIVPPVSALLVEEKAGAAGPPVN
jgi:hypothetical protein